jgi:mannose-6-phosphate isomerase-like protein (cupin superfamily)
MSEAISEKYGDILERHRIRVVNSDLSRPWGGFFVIDESQAQEFANHFIDGLNVNQINISGRLSPKLLFVKPQTRLSWQYHYRRSEIWKVVEGQVGIVRSFTDEETELQILDPGGQVMLKQGERHRLIGLDDWAVIAEIWQHTDANNPSNEEDIVRVQDDFGR